MEDNLFRETEPRIYATHPKNPEAGRVFVWAWTQWFERLEGDSGAVSFTPVANSEPELKKWLILNKCDRDLVEIKGHFAKDVMEEFLEQTPLLPESIESPFQQEILTEHMIDADQERE